MSHILPLSLDDLAPINDPYTPIGSPPTSNASSPRPPSPIGTLDSGYGEDDSYMPPQPPPPLSLDDLSSTPLSSNPSTEHSYNPLTHITTNSDGLLIPTKECPEELLTDIMTYFLERNEDE